MHPFAELLVEIVHANLSGSLRLARDAQKTIIYLNSGKVEYAVANGRNFRLFSLLLEQNKIEKNILAEHPGFANDLEFAVSLQAKEVFSKEQIDAAIIGQIEAIIIDALGWPDGEWHFNPLARHRSDLSFPIDIHRILINYARCLQPHLISNRFKSIDEIFAPVNGSEPDISLLAHEMFVLSRFDGTEMTIGGVRPLCALPERDLLQSLYVLWLGGMLVRRDWNAAFSERKINTILSAKMTMVKESVKTKAPAVSQEPEAIPETPVAEIVEKEEKIPEIEITLDEYLDRIEKKETLYDVLGVSQKATLAEIKHAYFGCAKLFHPDHYHREEAAKLRRIQVSFAELAQAYETLKNNESRETYDYKLRKEMEARENRRAAGQQVQPAGNGASTAQALECYEQGMNFLVNEEYGPAAAQLQRAVHFDPQNAFYHAHFGQALSGLEGHQHRAESEFQAAVKLEPSNPKIRLMLVEFFIEINMKKRAEGELKRFLEIVPGNKEAKALLDSLSEPPA